MPGSGQPSRFSQASITATADPAEASFGATHSGGVAGPVVASCGTSAAGAAAPALLVPPLSALNGFEVFVAALTVDPATATERRVTNWLRVRLQL